MPSLEALYGIYARYEEKLAKAIKEASPFAGVFHMGDDPRKNACNQVFYDAVEEWAEAFSEEQPDPEEAAAAVEWILHYPHEHRGANTYAYSYAAQKHAGKLIPFLNGEKAAQIRERFAEEYPKLDWNPVQKDVYQLLSHAAGAAIPEEEKGGKTVVWVKQVAALLLGLTIAHLGVTLFLLADLGSDPFNVMIQGLFRISSGIPGMTITHGTVHVAVSLLIILVLLVVDRRYVRIGTFLCMILGGPIIDVFTVLLRVMVNAGSPMALRLVAVVLGCGILAFGMTIVIKSEAGTGPNDLVAVVISDKRRWKFGVVRIVVDICFAAIGFLLGGTIGVGTIVCVAVVGPVAQLFMPFSERICKKLIG